MSKVNRVILVYPDYRNSDVFSGAYLPVGLGYVSKALEAAGIEYDIVDLNIDSINYLMDRIQSFEPQFLGISMMSYRCKEIYSLLHNVKDTFPELKIIAGGPHVTANREIVLIECSSIDFAVVGEGEVTLVELVRGDPVVSIKGVLYREREAVKFPGEREFLSNLDEVPFPTYAGFKLEKYGTSMVLHSSRGCPYKCIFCGAPRILGKKWRKRSAQGMVEELEYWYKRGYRNFYISDSNFGVEKKRVLEFCDETIRRNLDVTFTADGLRADHFDRFTLEKLKATGFTNLTFGVESGSEKILRNLRKGETREQIESAIATSTDLGFHVTLFFLIGSPGEDVKDVEQSFQLALKYNVANAYFFNLTPIPGTEFYDWAIEQGYMEEFKGRYPEGNFGFSKKASFRTDIFTINQLTRLIKKARRIERQIQWRYSLQKYLQKVTGKKIISKKGIFNTLSYFISYSSLTIVLRTLLRMIELVACTAKKFLRYFKCEPNLS
jgi:anaerobic magnesium-protoporphyrin IX monomethyl ester cyclase